MASGIIEGQKLIQRGNIGPVYVNSVSCETRTITFSVSFPNDTYALFLTMNSNQTDGEYGQCSMSYYSRSSTGFSIRFFNGSSKQKTFNVDWCAMEV